jgi:hypothetical protein
MIDLKKTRFICTNWPDKCWNEETVIWIEGLMEHVRPHSPDYRKSVCKSNIVCARNTAILKEAIGSLKTYEHFVFIDRDVRPTPLTTSFLELETDVKVCQMSHRSEAAWSKPDSFHESLWCTTRDVLEAVKPPWFQHTYNSTGTEMLTCLCHSFRTKVIQAGFTISHGGWAKHDQLKSWC